ncbi:hypothetical protein [Rhodobaculum claviforme]|uniref:Uncharacterized protein n=1 Tax=Rhodobaculum claviforme TaxID=1549854 RepID=A0A934WJQ6_9RHOB|nr:hypothetical protein [Rhodobaculum claviforme]MBK5928291.1 hypothetical protein [Rhodobaculum claviforme]
MFALYRFPNAKASTCGDQLAGMAHAMGCGTLVDDHRRAHPLIARPGQPGRDQWSRLHLVETPTVLR